MFRVAAVLIGLTLLTTPVGARTYDGRPASCPPRLWCGCWLAHYLGVAQEQRRELWVARNWLKAGRRISRPVPGAVVVYARGKGGHVGVIKKVLGHGKIVVKSGNDGGRVRERERSTRGVIGYVVVRS